MNDEGAKKVEFEIPVFEVFNPAQGKFKTKYIPMGQVNLISADELSGSNDGNILVYYTTKVLGKEIPQYTHFPHDKKCKISVFSNGDVIVDLEEGDANE